MNVEQLRVDINNINMTILTLSPKTDLDQIKLEVQKHKNSLQDL